jgi:peroxiredoxin
MKKVTFKSILTLSLLFSIGIANAQNEQKNGYQIGAIVSDFNLKNVDDRLVSMASLTETKGYILIFTCNTCPYAKMYEDRIIALDAKYKPLGYPVIAINSNDPTQSAGDNFAEMKKRAKAKKFGFPYLLDETQNVAKAYGATRTPEVYVVTKSDSGLKLAYSGAIDDNHKDANAAEKKYVETAMAEIMAGSKVQTIFTKAIGVVSSGKAKEVGRRINSTG